QFGAISVRKTAEAMPKGTAINKTINEETKVPKINGITPKCTYAGSGFKSALFRKRHTNFRSASVEPSDNSYPISTISKITVRAIARHNHLNRRSPTAPGFSTPDLARDNLSTAEFILTQRFSTNPSAPTVRVRPI